MKQSWFAGIVLAGVTVAGLALSGPFVGAASAADIAQEPAPVVASSTNDWRFQATIYGWLTGMNGDVGVRGLGPARVNLTASDVLSDLDGALMASLAAENDQFLFISDFIFARVSDDGTIRNGALGFDYTQNQAIVQGLAGYKLPLGIPNLTLSPTVGFRYMYLDADLGITPAGSPITLSDGGNKQWIDPTVGLYGHYDITDKWFINALGDIGGFGVGSDLTWQAFGAVGYNWTKTLSTSIGYRAIYEDYEDGGFVYNMTQQGVFAGLGIHF